MQYNTYKLINFKANFFKHIYQWLLYYILSIITLGIYSFWGIGKLRKFIIEQTSFSGNNLEFRSSAKEVFLGFIIACIFILPITALKHLYSADPFLLQGLIYLLDIIVAFASFILSIKYLYSRTYCKNINFRLEANLFKYTFWCMAKLFSLLTLNLLDPYCDLKRASLVYNNLYYGNNKLQLNNLKSMDLMATNIITTLLAIPTLFLSRLWYNAALSRYIFAHLYIEGKAIRFQSTISGKNLLKLLLTMILLFLICCGPLTYLSITLAKSNFAPLMLNKMKYIFLFILAILNMLLLNSIIVHIALKFYSQNYFITGNLDELDYTENNSKTIRYDYGFCATSLSTSFISSL